jgi:predicted nucleic-acid-binding Zn-ribbon protein
MEHNMNVDLSQTAAVTCDECGGSYFEQALIIRKVSALLTGQGKPGFIPIPIFKCSKCGHVNKEFLPREVQSLD